MLSHNRLLVYNAVTNVLLMSVPMPSASWNLAVDLASHDVYVTDAAANQRQQQQRPPDPHGPELRHPLGDWHRRNWRRR